MKKSIAVLLFVFIALFSTQAFAGGSADIPFWEYYRYSDNNYTVSKFFVVNRGEEELTVTMKLYDKDGNPVTKSCAYSWDDEGPFVPFNHQMVIPAHGLRVLAIKYGQQTTSLRGSGKINWEYSQESSTRSESMRKPLSVTIVTERAVRTANESAISISREPLLVDDGIWF